MQNHIDTIIFDIGNVLAKFRWQDYLHSFSFPNSDLSPEELFKRLSQAIFLSDAWKEADRGSKSDTELLQMMYNNAPDLKQEIFTVLTERPQEIVIEYDFSEQWLKELKQRGYRILVLSNYGKTLFQLTKQHFGFFKWIDGGVISYEIKHIKPEREIYETLINKYDIVPNHSVFLDDTAVNITAAKEIGFHTVLVSDHNEAVKQLESILNEL